MKILIATTSFPLEPGDGLSPFLWEFCLGLKKRGWDVTVVVPHHNGIKYEVNWNGIDIIRFKYLPERYEDLAYSGGLLPNIKKAPLQLLKLPFFIYAMYRTVKKLSFERRFDIVNFHWLFPASFWLERFIKKCGVPVVLTGHGTDIHLSTKFPFNIFAKSALNMSSALTLNSDYMKQVISRTGLPSRVEVIPMGVDTEKFKPSESKPSESMVVLFIGRLIKQKGIELLLEAFRNLNRSFPGSRLEIIGYGPEKRSVMEQIGKLGLSDSIQMLDSLSHELLADKYRSARVLVLPSLIGEGFGMTAAEAGSCGVPTLTFGLGGTSELVIDGETGLVVRRGVDGLTEGLIRLFSDDGLADMLGMQARQRVKSGYGWENISSEFDRLFKDVITTQKKGPPHNERK